MFGQTFYFGTIRKYIILFGTIFNDIIITRTDDSGTIAQAIKVPLTFAAKEKMLARIKQDPGLDQEAAIILPRMSFVYKGLKYDGDRKLNTVQRVVRKHDTDVNKFNYQYNPVPYNFNFSLYVYVKNAEDGTKIIEQILPYFTPEWSATVNIIPEHDIVVDIPIIIKGDATPEDQYEGEYTERRSIIWTIDFTLKGYLYGPIKKAPIIKFANTRFFAGNLISNTIAASVVSSNTIDANGYNTDIVDLVQVYPGLDANGDPTTDPDVAIDPLLVDLEDDWDYVIEKSGLVIQFE